MCIDHWYFIGILVLIWITINCALATMCYLKLSFYLHLIQFSLSVSGRPAHVGILCISRLKRIMFINITLGSNVISIRALGIVKEPMFAIPSHLKVEEPKMKHKSER